jgi:hypothetical protein
MYTTHDLKNIYLKLMESKYSNINTGLREKQYSKIELEQPNGHGKHLEAENRKAHSYL